jgi:hypothetical protein
MLEVFEHEGHEDHEEKLLVSMFVISKRSLMLSIQLYQATAKIPPG